MDGIKSSALNGEGLIALSFKESFAVCFPDKIEEWIDIENMVNHRKNLMTISSQQFPTQHTYMHDHHTQSLE